MNKPIRTTVVFALASGILALPLTRLLSVLGGYPAAFKWILWAELAVYALLLARWSRTRLMSILFPLVLLLGAAIWPGARDGFHALALGVLCWIRSGICYSGAPLRALTAELVAVGGGMALVMGLSSNQAAAWPLALCLFILVQTLYFFIMPMDSGLKPETDTFDPFEKARNEAENLIEQLP